MDTRQHFTNMNRKPWENADVRAQEASQQQIDILKLKPVIRLAAGQIGRVRLPEPQEIEGLKPTDQVEFVLIIGAQVFYVDTEGYGYARYAIWFSNLQPADFA